MTDDRRVLTSSRLSGFDARFHWTRKAFPSDQFLLFCFAAPREWPEPQAEWLISRARGIEDLNLVVREVPGGLDYPLLIPRMASERNIAIHRLPGRRWVDCLDAVAELIGDQLRADEAAWRIHLIGPVDDTPAGPGPAVVVVLQIAHVLGDGRRTSLIARDLLSHSALPDLELDSSFGVAARSAAAGAARFPMQFAQTLRWGMASYSESRRGVDPGVIGAFGSPGVPITVLNRPSGPRRLLRTVLLNRGALTTTGTTVTASVMSAIAQALAEYLDLGPGHPLAAELTIGTTPQAGIRNNFRNRGIPLATDVSSLSIRAQMIGTSIAQARAEARDRRSDTAWRAEQATPPALVRIGARSFDVNRIPERMTGVTVVSSVHRGAATLSVDPDGDGSGYLGGGQVLFTAGFPALSPMQGLTHGIHGIGDTVTVSVNTSPDVMPDVDRYVEMLRESFARMQSEGR